MARTVGTERTLDILVNCKTYPAVSQKYIETVCTGGIAREGFFVRLYPIPFRLLDEKEQYDRWDIIRVRVYRDTKDPRPESWHLEGGSSIEVLEHLAADQARWDWMSREVFRSTDEMATADRTNGLVEIIPEELYWEPEKKEWSAGQLKTLNQGNLFHGANLMKSLADRVPWQFKLRLTEKHTGKKFDQKVLAWSYYQGYRRALLDLGSEIKALQRVRETVYKSIMAPDRAVFAIFGTHSRFKHWMISALYHVPRKISGQSGLF